jgi:hypothetical protein
VSFFTPVFCLTLKNKKIVEGWVSLFLLYQPSIIFIAFSCQAWHITPAVGKQHNIIKGINIEER